MTHQLLSYLVRFLSTPSARRATDRLKRAVFDTVISIHALREEGDWQKSFSKPAATAFLSTPSARRATMPSIKAVI